jgi:small subunit ribosomal protein S2
MKAKEDWGHATKKEILKMEKLRMKLNRNLEGIVGMEKTPSVVFLIDPRREKITAAEARRLGASIVGVTDTNCDPDLVDFPIPGNDDAIRAIKLFTGSIADAVLEGKQIFEDNTRQRKSREQEKPKSTAEVQVQQDAVLPSAAKLEEDLGDVVIKVKSKTKPLVAETPATEAPAETPATEAPAETPAVEEKAEVKDETKE